MTVHSPSARRASFQPQVELLEARCQPSVGNFMTEPVVPIIDAATQAHLQAILTAGLLQGNRPNVFAKVGDSITESPLFLAPFGSPSYSPFNPGTVGSHADLAPTLLFFGQQPVDATGADSFSRASLTAHGGWGTLQILNPATQPLLNELRLLRPAFALIELGTNEVGFENNPEAFRARLTAVANLVLSQGTIPVLSTIPDVLGPFGAPTPKVLRFNQVIAEVADALDVPLWNYWLALQPLAHKGLGPDNLHPNSFPGGSGVLTDGALRFGFNVRNLTALQVLDKLRRLVVENEPADGAGPLSPEVVNYLEELYAHLLNREPDDGGMDFYGHLLQSGVPRAVVVKALWESPEHRGLQVDEYYAAYLHRAPDPSGRAYWVNAFLAGVTEETVRRSILTSAEYLNAHEADAAFAGIVDDLLGADFNPPSEPAIQNLLTNTADGATLIGGLLTSAERSEHLVNTYYVAFLGRDADGAGLGFWSGLLRAGFSTELVGEALLTSDEFWQAAQPK